MLSWSALSPSRWLSLSLDPHSRSQLSLPPNAPSHLIVSGASGGADASDPAFTLCEHDSDQRDGSPSSSTPLCTHATLSALHSSAASAAVDGRAEPRWDLDGARLSAEVTRSPVDSSAHRISWSAARVSPDPAAPPLLYSLFAEWSAHTIDAKQLRSAADSTAAAADSATPAAASPQPTLQRHSVRMCSARSADQRTQQLHCDVAADRLPRGVELTLHLLTECDYQTINAELAATLPHCLSAVSPELRVTLAPPPAQSSSFAAIAPLSFLAAPGVAQVADDAVVREALCTFYNRTSQLVSSDCTGTDVGWCVKYGWCDPAIPVCSWWDVQCDASGQFVTALLLQKNGLTTASPSDLSALFLSIPQLQQLDWSQNAELYLSAIDLSPLSNLTVLTLANLVSLNHTAIPVIFPRSCNLTTIDASSSYLDLSEIGHCPRITSLSVRSVITPFPFALIASLPALVQFDASDGILSSGPAGVYNGPSGVVTNVVLSRLNVTNPALRSLILSDAVMSFSAANITDNWPHIVSPTLVALALSNLPSLRTGPEGTTDDWLADLPSLQVLGLAELYNVRLSTAAFVTASTTLEQIDLTYTPVSGSLNSMCHLHRLTQLFADESGMRSTLPTNMSACFPMLQVLTLAGCALVGKLPDFRHMPNLELIDLSSNSLFGAIGETFCADSPNLGYLKLASNQLTEPTPSLCGTAVETLDLSANQIGVLPNMSCYFNVEVLLLSGNPMDSEVPANFWSLVSPTIDTIDFSYSLLHGPFPSRPLPHSVNKMTSFSIGHTRLSGALPLFIQANALDLSFANFSGAVILSDNHSEMDFVVTVNLESAGTLECPIALAQLRFLATLSLANASFTGCDWTDPSSVQLPQSLTDLDISHNQWKPMVLSVGPFWQVLKADNANVLGLLMPALSLAGKLTSISLNFNPLLGFATPGRTGALSTLAALEQSPYIQVISLVGCGITATLADVMPKTQVARLSVLRTLLLSNNSLLGVYYDDQTQSNTLSLPNSIEEFSLANNPGIQGKLPPVSPALASFRSFDVSGTALTGSMPPSWGELSTMTQLSLGTSIACTLMVDPSDHLQCADQTVLTGSQSTQVEAESLADPNASAHCAALVIVATGSTNVNADPLYHAHTLCSCDSGGFGLHARCYRCPEGCTCSADHITDCFPVVQRGSISVNPADASGSRAVIAGSIAPFSVTTVLPCPRTVTGSSLCNPDGIIWPSFYRISEQTGSASVSVALTDSDASSPSDSEIDLSDWCYPGHTGRLCAACSSGYFSSGRWCLRCLSEGVHALILVANLLLIVALIAYLYVKSPGAANAAKSLQLYSARLIGSSANGASRSMRSLRSDSAASASINAPESISPDSAADAANPLKLLIFHSQQLSLLLHTSTSLPVVMTGLLSFMSSGSTGFSLSSLVAMECLSNWTLRERCWMAVFVPALIGVFAGLTALFSRKSGSALNGSRAMQLQGRNEPLLANDSEADVSPSSSVVPRIYSVCVSLLYFLFFPCAQTVLSAVACTDTRESDRSYLNLFPAQACDDEWRQVVLPPAVLGLLFWVVAFPLGSTLMLFKLQSRLAASSGSDSSSMLSVWPICSDLLLPYTADRWYWEQLFLIRRLLLVAAVTIIPASSLYLPLVMFAIIQLSALQQHWAHPYAHPLLNAGELASLYLLLINYISALILQTGLTEGGFHQTANGWAAVLFVVNVAFLLILVAGLFGWGRQWIASRLIARKQLQRL